MTGKTVRLNVRLSPEDILTLKEASALLDITVAEFVRLTALKTAQAVITDGAKATYKAPYVSALSATADIQVEFLKNALTLRKSAGGKDDVPKDDT